MSAINSNEGENLLREAAEVLEDCMNFALENKGAGQRMSREL